MIKLVEQRVLTNYEGPVGLPLIVVYAVSVRLAAPLEYDAVGSRQPGLSPFRRSVFRSPIRLFRLNNGIYISCQSLQYEGLMITLLL